MYLFAEYVWHDAGRGEDDPMPRLRSKTKTIHVGDSFDGLMPLRMLPVWNFDGSSTGQSPGDNADLPLKPVRVVSDPFRGRPHVLVLCEVMAKDGSPHETNTRAPLVALLDDPVVGGKKPWLGFEQEYMLLGMDRQPLGFVNGNAPKQGQYYCGVGAREAHGRQIMEEHLQACARANLMIAGTNAEVCPGQWEFQIGPTDGSRMEPTEGDHMALVIADHLVLARYILHRVAEVHNLDVSLDVKPKRGDWNGSGCHTNFSTEDMREGDRCMAAIEAAISHLADTHTQVIAKQLYGYDLEQRLTGKHETCPIDEFRHGDSNRGASVRIPNHVVQRQKGYFEDRRPGSNCCPYKVATVLVGTICGHYATV